MSRQIVQFEYEGQVINAWDDLSMSLTDMWRAEGADPQKAPAKWRTLPSTKEFVAHIELTVGKSDSALFRVQNGGRNPHTRAHWQIGIAYAKYLSPKFHAWCNTVVRERMEGKVEAPRPRVTLRDVGGVVKAVTHKALVELAAQVAEAQAAFETRLREQIEASEKRQAEEQAAFRVEMENIAYKHDPDRTISRDFHTANYYVIKQKVPQKGRRAISAKCGNRMLKFALRDLPGERGKNLSHWLSSSNETGKRTFHHLLWAEWLRVEGDALIRAWNDERTGQSVLRLVQQAPSHE